MYSPIFRNVFLCLSCSVGLPSVASAEPGPGDVYREYIFTNSYGDAGGSIRVGGKRGESYSDRGADFGYINTPIAFGHKIDLEHAISAEVIVEKIQSHNGTKGLAIQFNDRDWIALPPPEALPDPKADYYHHTCIVAPVPLSQVDAGIDNAFRLRVSPEHPWNWPQHLVYGVHLRVYYDAEKKSHASATINSHASGDVVGRESLLSVEFDAQPRRIDRVDFVGLYENVNWPGDGIYRRWQYFYYRGQFVHHIGSSVVAPFQVTWDTQWLPDQGGPMRIAARIVDDSGLVFMTQSVDDLSLERPGLSVELCKPIDTPDNWVTRGGEFTQKLAVRGDVSKIRAARACWSSWSPGYMNGVYLNDTKLIESQGPRYRYYDHQVDVPDVGCIRSGENAFRTGKTPLHDGKMVHGMEVNWPGIQLLIQYDTTK